MAKLPSQSMQKLKRFSDNFAKLTGIKDFKFEDFENKAEELDKQNPGQGYQLAYQQNLINMFGKIINRYMLNEKQLPSLEEFVSYHDTLLMKSYFTERKIQGIEVNVKMNDNKIGLETLEAFDKALKEHPHTTILEEVSKKFDSGEITLNSTYDFAKKKAKTIPSKEDARNLVAYASFLEKRNEERSIFRMLLSLPTHFKERSAIKAMRTLASKCDSVENLMLEVTTESSDLRKLKQDVQLGILVEKDRAKPLFTDKIVAEIEKGIGIDDTLVLDSVDDSLLVDDDKKYGDQNVSFEELLDQDEDFTVQEIDAVNNNLNTSEKIEFNESEFDIFHNDVRSSKVEIDVPVTDKQISK